MNQALPAQTVSELSLGTGRPAGREREPLQLEFVRSLNPSDIPAIQSPPPGSSAVVVVKSLRHSHHRLAELIAAGRPPGEIAIVTGYSPGYISSLKGDPAFAELVAYYEFQKKSIFVDAMERLKVLGLDAIEKLQERLNDPEKTWSNKELMDLVDMAAVQPNLGKNAAPPAQSGGGNNTLVVKFVGATPVDQPVVDVNYTEVK